MTMGSTLSTSTSASSSPATIDLVPLLIFAAALLFFHGSEFALAYSFQRKTLSRRCESLLCFVFFCRSPFLCQVPKKKSSSVSHQNNKKKLPPPTQETPLETAEEKAVAEKED